MRIIWGYFKERAWFALLLVLCVGLFAQVLRLYDLPAEAVGYASLLCGTLLVLWGAVDWARWRRRTALLESLRGEEHIELAGFVLRVLKKDLEAGSYRIGMLCTNQVTGEKALSWSEKEITV